MAAAKALGYQPNVLARSLITGQSGMVAVIVSQTSSRYYPEIVELLAGALERAGKKMLLFYTDGRIDRVEAVLQKSENIKLTASLRQRNLPQINAR